MQQKLGTSPIRIRLALFFFFLYSCMKNGVVFERHLASYTANATVRKSLPTLNYGTCIYIVIYQSQGCKNNRDKVRLLNKKTQDQ